MTSRWRWWRRKRSFLFLSVRISYFIEHDQSSILFSLGIDYQHNCLRVWERNALSHLTVKIRVDLRVKKRKKISVWQNESGMCCAFFSCRNCFLYRRGQSISCVLCDVLLALALTSRHRQQKQRFDLVHSVCLTIFFSLADVGVYCVTGRSLSRSGLLDGLTRGCCSVLGHPTRVYYLV